VAEPIVVVGGSIAALVAADTIAGRGRSVRLLLPERGVGSGFLPIEVRGRRLELGPRLIELAYDDEPAPAPSLAAYRPGPHGHRPYLQLVQQVVTELAGDDLRPARRPDLVRGGSRGLDFLLCGDLVDLPRLVDHGERQAIATESAEALGREGTAGVLAPERERELWQRTLAEASVHNHGRTFHEMFIEAIASKVVPGGSASVLAALRRKIWLPLFYPATLHDAVAGALDYRPERPIHTIADGGMGVLVARLLERCRAQCEEVVVRPALSGVETTDRGGVCLLFGDGTTEQVREAVLAAGAEEVFRAGGVSCSLERIRTVLAWVDVDATAMQDPPSTLFAVDPDVEAYRVSESTASREPGKVTLTVELRHDIAAEEAAAAAVRSLLSLGLIQRPQQASVVHTAAVLSFTAPSRQNKRAFDAAQRAFAARGLPVEVAGPACGFGADAFNEQVLQGLAVAERLS
jgi:hypothetical protein